MKRLTKEQYAEINAQICAFDKDRNLTHKLLSEYSGHILECKPLYMVPAVSEECFILQGGGTDGRYLYLAMVTPKVDGYQDGHIIKLEPESGEVIKVGPRIKIDHANDITYNPKMGKLLVVHNVPHCHWLSVVEPETLDVDRIIEMPGVPVYSVSYNAKRDCYAVGRSNGQGIGILDSDFKLINHYDFINTRYITQGMTSDDDYIYFVQHAVNCVMKYDWEGNFIEYLPLSKRSGEPENIWFVNGKFYMAGSVFTADRQTLAYVYRLEETPFELETVKPEEHKKINEEIAALNDRTATREYMMRYCARRGYCKHLFDIGPFDDCIYLQGGGTDGKYLYLAFVTPKVDGHQDGIVVKVDQKTGDIIKKSERLAIDHANDITYNPRLNKILVVHNAPRTDLVTLLDPETLEFVETVKLPLKIFSMDYNAKRDRYVVGKSGGQNFATLKDLTEIRHEYEAIHTRFTTQGVGSDDDYIYFVQHNKACLMKYDWAGNFVEFIPLMDVSGLEPENVCFINGRLYVSFNTFVDGRSAVYEVDIK